MTLYIIHKLVKVGRNVSYNKRIGAIYAESYDDAAKAIGQTIHSTKSRPSYAVCADTQYMIERRA